MKTGSRVRKRRNDTQAGYEARRVSFFTIQLFSRYRFQEQNICASRGPLFGRGPREDLEISTAASPPNHVLSYSYQVNIETPLLHHVKFTLPAGRPKVASKQTRSDRKLHPIVTTNLAVPY